MSALENRQHFAAFYQQKYPAQPRRSSHEGRWQENHYAGLQRLPSGLPVEETSPEVLKTPGLIGSTRKP